MYPVWVIFLLFGFSGLKDCTSCCSWQAQSIQLFFATACGWQCRRTLAVAAGAIQITLTRPRQGFLTFFWLLLEKNKMHTGGVTSESRVNHMWRLEKDFGANQVHSSALGDRLRLCEVWLVTCVWSCSCGTMWNSPSGKCFSCALLENLW